MEHIEIQVVPSIRATDTTYHLFINKRTIVHAGTLGTVVRACIGIVDSFKACGFLLESDDTYPTNGRRIVLSRDSWVIGRGSINLEPFAQQERAAALHQTAKPNALNT